MASNVGTAYVNVAYGRCKDCRHWSGPGVKSYANPHEMARCRLVRQAHAAQRADAMIAAEGSARIWTGPDFGCIHFEEKP